MGHVLLTGAGFSRNWGGWLANEAFEYLLGCPEVDGELREKLWQTKLRDGGFEDTLADLQIEHARRNLPETEKPLRNLEAALVRMFNEMNQGLVQAGFEPQNDLRYMFADYFVRFDAIFTLNQDLLLERHYLNRNVT